MSKDARDLKHKHDGPRQPHRKDSLSSVLSWAGFIAAPKAPGNHPLTGQHSTQASSSGSNSKPRRHSVAGPDTKKKTPSNLDSKPQAGASKADKNRSSEKVHKSVSDPLDAPKSMTRGQSAQPAQEKPRSPTPPMPKSILRVSSPDGCKRPRQFVNPETGEPVSPGESPTSPVFGTLSLDSPPGSPPMSPVQRPMSPGTTVRFAKATIHRVEVGPGRRFLPVKRKSKSTLTYISPLDPGTQKSAPKTMLQSPTKMRRHQENQAAMGRYWMRTEEEEAQWRAEAERRAEEEAERYRNEPASPPPPVVAATTESAVEAAVGTRSTLADKVTEIDKVTPRDLKPNPDKLEEEEAESSESDTDEEAGAKCCVSEKTGMSAEETDETARMAAGKETGSDASDENFEGAPKATLLNPTPTPTVAAKIATRGTGAQTPAVALAGDTQTPTAGLTRTETLTQVTEGKPTDSQAAEKHAAEERAGQTTTPGLANNNPPGQAEAGSKTPNDPQLSAAGSSPSSLPTGPLSKDKDKPAPTSSPILSGGQGLALGLAAEKRPGSPIQLVSCRARPRSRSRSVSPRSSSTTTKPPTTTPTSSTAAAAAAAAAKISTPAASGKNGVKSQRAASPTSSACPGLNLKSGGGSDNGGGAGGGISSSTNSSSNHLHLSGRRGGRRCFDEHHNKPEITA